MNWIAKYWIEWAFSILIVLIGIMWRRLTGKLKQAKEEQDAIKAGLQALLRAQMVNDYQHYSEKGSAPMYARDNFENCWIQYERLGENGVMRDLHAKFMALPIDKG